MDFLRSPSAVVYGFSPAHIGKSSGAWAQGSTRSTNQYVSLCRGLPDWRLRTISTPTAFASSFRGPRGDAAARSTPRDSHSRLFINAAAKHYFRADESEASPPVCKSLGTWEWRAMIAGPGVSFLAAWVPWHWSRWRPRWWWRSPWPRSHRWFSLGGVSFVWSRVEEFLVKSAVSRSPLAVFGNYRNVHMTSSLYFARKTCKEWMR